MNIIWHERSKQFHLYNDFISYVMHVQPDGRLGQLYYGAKIHDKEDMTYLANYRMMPLTAYADIDVLYSADLNLQEYPDGGRDDFGTPAFRIFDEDGSGISGFCYVNHTITEGKKELPGLPATYASVGECMSLEIELFDALSNVAIRLLYSVFRDYPVITRSVTFENRGDKKVVLDRALSLSLDLPAADYEWMQFSGAWARERRPVTKKLKSGITAIESRRGHSSPHQNPFVIIKRPETGEESGEAMGFSFVYSGNFLAQAQVNANDRLRFAMGIHPETFSWQLAAGESFVTPEVVMARSDKGLGALSRTFHDLYNAHLVRGQWKGKERPILLNNWEATFMDFDEEAILKIAGKAAEAGAELFVLDDGWFGARDDDRRGLGDWIANPKKLPGGIKGLAEKVEAMGLKFGLWIEPEMVNPDSDLYRKHPDYALAVPGRKPSLGRWQMVLDYSRKEVVDAIHDMLYAVLKDAPVSYIKWDMNRSITECFSNEKKPEEQGKVYHQYILGMYSLYERLREEFPKILFESCSSGGGRFDAGMLYYAPQAWCSDNTDGQDRLQIQYGSSYGYPISSIGAHVSAIPNQQTGRSVPIEMRANVAMFGAFGYELDLNHISAEEFETVKEQIRFVKEHRALLQYGDFYRLRDPFYHDQAAWMVVSKDKKQAVLAVFTITANVNRIADRLQLSGLDPDRIYQAGESRYYGDELMHVGIAMREECIPGYTTEQDHSSAVLVLESVE
ncbi:MAG: alpha-galactosidase [Lachnospiraceae bacterium]|nr:alpha-galactosidase [Lachnospiraceae bacterium]